VTGAGPELLLAVISMAVVTYLLRAGPLLLPGSDRLPRPVIEYLGLVAPAMLAGLAAVGVAVSLSPDANGVRVPSLRIGVEWLSILLAGGIVAVRGSLLLALIAAVTLVALARLLGVAS
jgi:branched-subunit amino acid transport protein